MLTEELKERQASVVRTAILDALADLLETTDPDDIALSQLADNVGVSTRTVYRYFSTREVLFQAVGDHIVGRLGLPVQVGHASEITANFLAASALGAQHPQLVRSMLHTRLGRQARSPHRQRRLELISQAVDELTHGLPEDEACRRAAVIAYLCSLSAWVTISEESGLDSAQARQAVAWGLDTLLAAAGNPTPPRSMEGQHDPQH